MTSATRVFPSPRRIAAEPMPDPETVNLATGLTSDLTQQALASNPNRSIWVICGWLAELLRLRHAYDRTAGGHIALADNSHARGPWASGTATALPRVSSSWASDASRECHPGGLRFRVAWWRGARCVVRLWGRMTGFAEIAALLWGGARRVVSRPLRAVVSAVPAGGRSLTRPRRRP